MNRLETGTTRRVIRLSVLLSTPAAVHTILFSDIEGSTAMNERLGDQVWQELLRKHNALIREQLRAHGGFEVKTMGDGFMMAFASADRALQCAIGIQRALAERNERAKQPIRVRIGLDTGEADPGGGRLLRQARRSRVARRRRGQRRRDPRVVGAEGADGERRRRQVR